MLPSLSEHEERQGIIILEFDKTKKRIYMLAVIVSYVMSTV